MQTQPKIAVIGAGVAGLSCASALQSAGYSVTIFEKSRGPSGRLSTRIKADWQCDHGAQYFTARNPTFNAEVARWINAGVAKPWQAALHVFDGNTFQAKTTNTDTTVRYVGFPKNHSPAYWLISQLDFCPESTVVGICQTNSCWQIKTKEHGLLNESFDSVILAIPAPQAAVLLQPIASHAHSICQSVEMQPCFALMLALTAKIKPGFDGLFINHGCLSWIANDSAKPGRNHDDAQTWVLHASSDWSERNVNAEHPYIIEEMLKAFHFILQKAIPNQEPEALLKIKQQTLHRWLYADCKTYLEHTFYYDQELKIGLCGDWLNGGKIQGAWLSGHDLAKKLIQMGQ